MLVLKFYGGEAGIRTLGGDKPSTVFKTAAFDHSATSPKELVYYYMFFHISSSKFNFL